MTTMLESPSMLEQCLSLYKCKTCKLAKFLLSVVRAQRKKRRQRTDWC